MNTLVVIAKAPLAGRVKTRLAPPLTADTAADVAAAALRRHARVCSSAPPAPRAGAVLSPAIPTGWAPPGWRGRRPADVRLPRTVRLVSRVCCRTWACRTGGYGHAAAAPGTPRQVRSGALRRPPGPATDGGFWAIGFADPTNAAGILGVPMSTARTGAVQLGRLRDLGLRVQLLDELTDVDDIASAAVVAGLAPRSRFAAQLLAALDEDVA